MSLLIKTPFAMPKAPVMPDLCSINLIGEGSELEGSMKSNTDVRVNGRIVGDLSVRGKVIVADKGIIEGTLEADSADIAGHVKGQVRIGERLLLKSTAVIDGEISTARLVVEEGATFEGNCTMGRLDPERKAAMGDGQPAGKQDAEPVLGRAKK